eukprot:g61862.t1
MSLSPGGLPGLLKSQKRYQKMRPGTDPGYVNGEDAIEVDLPANTVEGEKEKAHVVKGNRLDTFHGVFVPCIMSIVNAILFQRLPFIVGQAGVFNTALMLAVSEFIVITTTLCLSALATNGRMRGGGIYYLISRTLGAEMGAAIGLISFLSHMCATAMWCLAFVEFVQGVSGGGERNAFDRKFTFLVAEASLLVSAVICYSGAEMFAKSNLIMLAGLLVAIVASLLSLLFQTPGKLDGYVGPNFDNFKLNLYPHFSPDQSFFTIMSLAVPATTGNQAGFNISGDLADPHKSLPIGTLSAIGVAWFLYFVCFVLSLASSVTPELLADEVRSKFLLTDLNWFPPLISLGIFVAVFSSISGSMIGAAKILQALAKDDTLPGLFFLGQGSADRDEPRRAVLLTAGLTTIILASIQDLNRMAVYLTMCFMLSNAVICFACAVVSLYSSPNWRPTFPYYSWQISLVGGIGALAVMFLLDIQATVASMLCLVGLVALVHYRLRQRPAWGNFSQSVLYHQVRKYLLQLDESRLGVNNWRPQALLLVKGPEHNWTLIQLANNIKKGGLFLLGHVILGDLDKPCTVAHAGAMGTSRMRQAEKHKADKAKNAAKLSALPGEGKTEQVWMADEYQCRRSGWLDYIKATGIKAFPCVTVAESLPLGIRQLLLISGLGVFRPNVILLGFPPELVDNTSTPPSDSADHRSVGELYAAQPVRSHEIQKALCHFPAVPSPSPSAPCGSSSSSSCSLEAPVSAWLARGRERGVEAYVSVLQDCVRLQKSVILARDIEKLPPYLVDSSLPAAAAKTLQLQQAHQTFRPAHVDAADGPAGQLNNASVSREGVFEGYGNGRAMSFVDVWLFPFDTTDREPCLSRQPSLSRLAAGPGLSYLSHSNAVAQLCMMLGYLLHRSASGSWSKHTKLRLLAVVDLEEEKVWMEAQLQELIRNLRMEEHFRAVRVVLAPAEEVEENESTLFVKRETESEEQDEDPHEPMLSEEAEKDPAASYQSPMRLYNRVVSSHLQGTRQGGVPTVLTILPMPPPPRPRRSGSGQSGSASRQHAAAAWPDPVDPAAGGNSPAAQVYFADLDQFTAGLQACLLVHASTEVCSGEL